MEGDVVLAQMVNCCNYEMPNSVTRKKSPNVYKSCPKMISLEKSYILTTLQKFLKNLRDLAKLSVAKSIQKLVKVR